MKNRIVYTIILILWMSLIFWFSNQNGIESSNTSNMFINKIIDVVNDFLNIEINDSFIEDFSFIIRKLAHFTLYFILGIISFLTFKSYNISNYALFAILFTVFYAFTDELHQIFVSGRTFQIMDIFIDSLGGLLSINILNFIKKQKRV